MLRVIYDQPNGETAPVEEEAPATVTFGSGFHAEEWEDSEPFRWMGSEATLELPPRPEVRYLEMGVFTPFYDLSQVLSADAGGERCELELVHGWGVISIPVPSGASRVRLALSRLMPPQHHPADTRDLGVRVRSPRVHSDPGRHEHLDRQHANGVRNVREMLAGETALGSTPRSLGIDLYGVCNVKPPCVYCDWDFSKELEGGNVDVPFTRDTLVEWGELFDNAANLVNCSIGEPFMMKNFDELLDAFGEQGKTLEMATNGQILTDRNVQKLLGRRIHLYISLDAATPDTYAKLRNDRFDRILVNLRKLIAAKGGRAGLPNVHMVFMPMRVNVHELPDFVRLCADLGVDRMVLRPLNYNEATQLDWERAGHHFKYENELLPWEELVRVSGRAAELCRRYGVELSDQMDFGGAMGEGFPEEFARGRREGAAMADEDLGPEEVPTAPVAISAAALVAEEPVEVPAPDAPRPSLGEERQPLCTEPWKSLYILRRGVLPCCYGSSPIAGMSEYRETWNGPMLQDIRRDLAAGRFHEYCLSAEACPIVRKSKAAEVLTRGERAFLRAKSLWHGFDRLGRGVPHRLLGPVKRPLASLVRRVTALAG